MQRNYKEVGVRTLCNFPLAKGKRRKARRIFVPLWLVAVEYHEDGKGELKGV
jgi:hypothetical protein